MLHIFKKVYNIDFIPPFFPQWRALFILTFKIIRKFQKHSSWKKGSWRMFQFKV